MERTKIFLLFLLHSLMLLCQKNTGLNSIHYFIMKIPNKQDLQQNAFNHSSNINFKDFINLYKNALQNHILFTLFMLLLHQIILHVSEKIFEKKLKTNQDS